MDVSLLKDKLGEFKSFSCLNNLIKKKNKKQLFLYKTTADHLSSSCFSL